MEDVNQSRRDRVVCELRATDAATARALLRSPGLGVTARLLLRRGRARLPRSLRATWEFTLRGGVCADELAKSLAARPEVTLAYVAPRPSAPPGAVTATDWRSHQHHLDPAPRGIDARYAWGLRGGGGEGQGFVDLEQGWRFEHDDLAPHRIQLISGLNHAHFHHGTCVLGEVAAVERGTGCTGVTPRLATVRCVSQHRRRGAYSTPEAILDAALTMAPGDVLLLEAQMDFGPYRRLPVEVEPKVFELVALATALGIVVVEPAGDGGADLDAVVDARGRRVFDRRANDFHDSGAIVVGAASAATPHERLDGSGYGNRVDCYGWGERVVTSSWDDAAGVGLHTLEFGGTSSAAALVAGAALAVQGIAQASTGERLSPAAVRALLSDPALTTPSAHPAMDRIGAMPDLRAIIERRFSKATRRS